MGLQDLSPYAATTASNRQDLSSYGTSPALPTDDDGALTIEDLGTLQQFVDFSRLGKDPTKLVETVPIPGDNSPPELAWDLPAAGHDGDCSAPDEQQDVRFISRPPRRQVQRLGDKVNLQRSKCPRHLQLLQAFAADPAMEPPQVSPQKQLPSPADVAAPGPRAATAPARATSSRGAAERRREPPLRAGVASSAAAEPPASARAVSSRAGKEGPALVGAVHGSASDAMADTSEKKRPHSQGGPASGRPFKTNFGYSFLAGTDSKPRPEKHHLLSRIQKDDEVEGTFREMDTARTNLTRRLEDLRAGNHGAHPGGDPLASPSGRGAATERRSRLLSGEDEMQRLGQLASAAGTAAHSHSLQQSARSAAAGRERQRLTADLKKLTWLMDPGGKGSIPCGVFTPLLFWLGLAQHQTAALATLRLAFGPGEAIPMSAMTDLIRFAEVEIRLGEGLRRLARLESLMPLCEFLTECDGWRLRSWFRSMRHDLDGRADVAEMQRWLAQTEIITDRQALFRFLCQVTHGEVVVNHCSGLSACKAWALHPSSEHFTVESGSGAERFGEVKHRGGFSLDDFASMLCRCVIAWCLHRTLFLLAGDPTKALESPAEEEEEGKPLEVSAAAWGEGSSLAMRWTQLQRKIAVSFLINGELWGRESRAVMGSMKPSEAVCVGEDLSPEQWNLLFQRARAQGLASTLPSNDEVARANHKSAKKKAGHHGHHRAKT